jgi:hypothetical protein
MPPISNFQSPLTRARATCRAAVDERDSMFSASWPAAMSMRCDSPAATVPGKYVFTYPGRSFTSYPPIGCPTTALTT